MPCPTACFLASGTTGLLDLLPSKNDGASDRRNRRQHFRPHWKLRCRNAELVKANGQHRVNNELLQHEEKDRREENRDQHVLHNTLHTQWQLNIDTLVPFVNCKLQHRRLIPCASGTNNLFDPLAHGILQQLYCKEPLNEKLSISREFYYINNLLSIWPFYPLGSLKP